MELVGESRPSGAGSLLGPPGLSYEDVDDDEGEVVIGIRPKSSPLPRRRTSVCEEDSEPEPPPCGSRRVSFADAKGLTLVCVKEFDTWDIPKPPGYELLRSECENLEECRLSLRFSLPSSTEELVTSLQERKVALETVELLPGTTTLKGVIRVLNISFDKMVYIRTSLDAWASHFDLLAEYIPGSSDGVTDCFLFKLTLVPPFGEQGARVDFCLRYETPVGTFWANNGDGNYVVFCHQRGKELKDKERQNVCKKSCLKAVSQNFTTVENEASVDNKLSLENVLAGISKHGKVASIKSQQNSDCQSGTSEEDRQKLLIENSQNCSRRSRRRAARLARVKDRFAERDGKPNDKESETSHSETPQTTREENPPQTRSDVSDIQSLPVDHGEPREFISEFLLPSSKASPDVRHGASPAQGNTSDDKPEKPESSVMLNMSGKETTATLNNPSHSDEEPGPPQHHSDRTSASQAQGNRQRQMKSNGEDMNDGSTDAAREPNSNVSWTESVEGPVSQASGFTFGTVVAPLYRQAFDRVGSENQNLADQGNPARGRLTMGSASTTQSSSVFKDLVATRERERVDAPLNKTHSERRRTTACASEDTRGNHAESLGDQADAQESAQECTVTPKDSKPFSEEAMMNPRNILDTDALKTNIPRESLHLQGKSLEDNLTHDPQSNNLVQKQTTAETAETAQAQPPEGTLSQIKTQPDTGLSQTLTQSDTTCIQPRSLQPQVLSVCASAEMDQETSAGGATDCEDVDESKEKEDIHTTMTVSTTDANSEQNKQLDAIQDFTTYSTTTEADNSSTGDQNVPVSFVETAEDKLSTEKDVSRATRKTSLGTGKEPNDEATRVLRKDETKRLAENERGAEVAETIAAVVKSSFHKHTDMFTEVKGEDPLVEKTNSTSGKEEHCDVEDTVTKQEDVNPEQTAEERNWEMMVEEEEEDILRDEEGREVINKEDIDEEEEQEGQQTEQEEEGLEKVEKELEELEEEATEIIKIIEDMMKEIIAADEEDEEGEDVRMEDKETVGEENIMKETVVEDEDVVEMEDEQKLKEEDMAEEEEDIEELQEEDDFVAMKEEKITEEEVVEEVAVGAEEEEEQEEEVKRELEEEEVRATQKDDNQAAENQEEEEEEEDIEMEIDMDVEEEETGADLHKDANPREENMDETEEEIPDYKEETVVSDAGDTESEEELVETREGTAAEEREDETGNLEQRSDGRQNKAENDLSAPVNDVLAGGSKTVIDDGNTAERENARGPNTMHFHKEGEDHSDTYATNDRRKAVHRSERDETQSGAAEGGSRVSTDEPERDPAGEDSSSTGSPSDEEVELYMHCVKAAQRRSLGHAARVHNKGAGLRPPIGRGKQLPSSMPSISESVDEEHSGCIQDSQKDFQPTSSPPPAADQEYVNRNAASWRETFSCSNISKTLLYTMLLVVFLVVAYHYDFLACFALYLISVCWLCCQGDKRPGRQTATQ